MRSVEELVKPSPIMMMFFNFGFMDAEVLGKLTQMHCII